MNKVGRILISLVILAVFYAGTTATVRIKSLYSTERYAYGLTGDVLKHQTVYGYGAGGEDLFTYTYDASGRLASTGIGVDGGPVRMLEKRGYDPVGRLSHITSPGVDITCGYNIRGWVTGIDGGAAFRQKLYYAEESGQSLPLYSGDISRNEWTSHIIGDAGYSYFYDGAGRLAEARYSGDGHYSSAYCYDANGNLTGIFRSGTEVDGTETVVDDLTLTYSGNWLESVSDRGEDTGSYGVMEFVDRSGSSEEYAYDAAGNLTRDLNKDIVDNRYNPINMPQEIRFADGGRITYTYDADGRKLRERYIDAEGRQIFRRAYDGSRVYRDGSLERIVTLCGYVTGGRIYTYVKDYQGNVRSVVRDDGEAVEATDYYPYGTPFSTERNVQPYKYGGKELNRMHGLDLYDSRARHYDPLLGRTTTMDSEAETTPWLSPYAWCNGNPIRYIDPDGMDAAVLLVNPSEGQHMALLIQDENKKWQYYSVNGNNVYISGNFMGGRKFNDVGVGKWDSPQQFIDSKYNSKGDKNDKSINGFGYDRAYVISSSSDQDEIMRNSFSDTTNNTEYKILGNNCATAVQKALYDAGISVASPSEKTLHISANPHLGEPGFKITVPNFRYCLLWHSKQ